MKYEAEFPNSSMLASCSYDDKTQELTVWFRNSKDYTYVDVDKSIFEAMRDSNSVGKYFNSIKSTLKQKT